VTAALMPPNGFPIHRFVAVLQLDVVVAPNETAADAERYARTALVGSLGDPGDDVTVVSMTQVAQ
jgi:hypothetical protein